MLPSEPTKSSPFIRLHRPPRWASGLMHGQPRARRTSGETVPSVTEMQSEGGAAGAVHGALQTGALTTTFTASQGLLLMIPNMFKIAGELTVDGLPRLGPDGRNPCAVDLRRSQRRHGHPLDGLRPAGLELDPGDHGLRADRPGRRRSRRACPFIHFFDGFRSSHEVMKIEQLTEDDMRAMIDDELVRAHRMRAPFARKADAPRHRAESGRLLPGPRGVQPLLRGRPGDRSEGDGQVRYDRRDGSTTCSITSARRMRNA